MLQGFSNGELNLMVQKRDVKSIRLLLEQKEIDVNQIDNDGHTALIHACNYGYGEIVKLLLEQKDIDVNHQDNPDNNTALMWACRHDDIVKLLLKRKNVDVNLQTSGGYTALMHACCNGIGENVRLLLEREDINIDMTNRFGLTALYYVCNINNSEILKLLLAKGAKVECDGMCKGGKGCSFCKRGKWCSCFNISEKIYEILDNRRTYLPRWNRFTTCKYYPQEFNDIALSWLFVCKYIEPKICKDIQFLLLEYIAEVWKE